MGMSRTDSPLLAGMVYLLTKRGEIIAVVNSIGLCRVVSQRTKLILWETDNKQQGGI